MIFVFLIGPLGAPGIQMASDKTFKNKVAQFRYLCYVRPTYSPIYELKLINFQSNSVPNHVKVISNINIYYVKN
jgi:hypothetical protein